MDRLSHARLDTGVDTEYHAVRRAPRTEVPADGYDKTLRARTAQFLPRVDPVSGRAQRLARGHANKTGTRAPADLMSALRAVLRGTW